jgi:hypothetical protein
MPKIMASLRSIFKINAWYFQHKNQKSVKGTIRLRRTKILIILPADAVRGAIFDCLIDLILRIGFQFGYFDVSGII